VVGVVNRSLEGKKVKTGSPLPIEIETMGICSRVHIIHVLHFAVAFDGIGIPHVSRSLAKVFKRRYDRYPFCF
jgi:hypothetical protein